MYSPLNIPQNLRTRFGQRSRQLTQSALMAVVLATTSALPALAEPADPTLISLGFPTSGQPRSTAGAGQRAIGNEDCVATNQGVPGLTALTANTAVSKAAEPNPTFLVYIPQTNALLGEFTLTLDSSTERVYQETVFLPEEPSILEITLPQEIALRTDRVYDWRFAIVCDLQDPNNNVVANGKVERTAVTPELAAQLSQASGLAKAELYANAGIWHEAAALAVRMRSQNSTEWSELLEAVGFTEPSGGVQQPLVDAPIVSQQ
ncbi:MAG: DUF928 domain-containing protein [Cyanobacteria bacterium P01_H01_bin.121]